MKKLTISLILSLVMALTLGLTACTEGGSDKRNKFNELITTESVYGFSAASAGMLISAAGNVGNAKTSDVKTHSAAAAESSETSGNDDAVVQDATVAPDGGKTSVDATSAAEQSLSDETAAELDRYMGLVESLLSDGAFTVITEASDREGYSEKMVVGCKNMQGDDIRYVMYYNQKLEKSEKEDDESEEEYGIEGIMVIDGADYEIRGEKSSEIEGEESESETEFKVILGENSYMLVEQSLETENGETEREYAYLLIENGVAVEKSSFKYEEENDETEVKMTSYKDGKTQVVYFERETYDGAETIRLSIADGVDKTSYVVKITKAADGSVEYDYVADSDGGIDRSDDDDYGDDEDDD